jgi:type I restriction enzyme M protein
MTRTKKSTLPQHATTAQSLGSLIKSARGIMRKDRGLNGDLDRLRVLTWVMFLKFLDDLEIQRHEEAKLAGRRFKPAIDVPYRWRDWAAKADGVTGDELLTFINDDQRVRPDGIKGPGLFAYLRTLSSLNGDNRRDVIARVFEGAPLDGMFVSDKFPSRSYCPSMERLPPSTALKPDVPPLRSAVYAALPLSGESFPTPPYCFAI